MSEDDPFLWLEEVEGAAALQWVRAENARSLDLLEADPRYAQMHRAALAVVTATDRIPYPSFLGDRLVNFWQDDQHVRGLWRVTSLASFASDAPDWQTLLDVDALAAAERRNWVFQGASVLRPDYRRALVSLSDGGKDASERREFDLATGRFVERLRVPRIRRSRLERNRRFSLYDHPAGLHQVFKSDLSRIRA